MIRVLHIFECFRQGGIENFVMNVYRNIDRKEFAFDFAFITREEGVFDKEANELGGHIYFFDTEKKTLTNYKKSITRIITQNGPYDVVHSHMYYFSGYILGIAKKCGVKVRIAHSHDTVKGRKPTLYRKSYESLMRHLIKRNATKMVACSDLAGKYVFGEGADFTVLYNGIDVDRFTFNPDVRAKVRQNLGIDNNIVYLNVGRFSDQKNHYFMLDFSKEMVKEKSETVLILVGSGVLKGDVENRIKKLGLENNVIILSNIYNIEDYYCAADCFILPSKYEGMPIVSIEAQASGLEAFLSDTITKEVAITDGIYYLPIDNIEKWSKRLLTVNTVIDKRKKQSNLIRNSKFDIKNTVKQLGEIYRAGK